MGKIAGLLLLVAVINSCDAQHRVQKAEAFFTVSIAGMAMKDENGNIINPQPAIERFIYIECKCSSKPKIDSVFYNGILFVASIADKEETSLKIGMRVNDQKPVNLVPKKGNHTWKIDLQQLNGATLKHEEVKKITIKGRLDKVKFNYAFNSETELSTPDRN